MEEDLENPLGCIDLASNDYLLFTPDVEEKIKKINNIFQFLLIEEFPNYKLRKDDIAPFGMLLKVNSTIKEFNFPHLKGISNKHFEIFCKSLETNSTLQKLTLSFLTIPPENIKFLTQSLYLNTTLETLLILRYVIGNKEAECFGLLFKNNTGLKKVHLTSCKITPLGSGLISEGLKVNKTLKELNLNRNDFGDLGAKHLSQALMVNSTLKKLSLNQTDIENEGVIYLAEAIRHNSTLRRLFLQDNLFKETGIKHLFDALSCNASIKSVCLNNSSVDTESCEAIAKCLSQNKAIKELDIHNINFPLDLCTIVAKGLFFNYHIEKLSLTSAGIHDEEGELLCEAISSLRKLKHLALAFNNLGNKSIQKLVIGLKKHNLIEHLNLENNSLISDISSLQTLFQFPKIKFLRLSGINLKNYENAFKGLSSNSSITQLDLERTNLGDSEMFSLFQALKSNSTLKSVLLSKNNITWEGTKPIADYLMLNPSLERLSINSNKIGSKGFSLILSSLLQNKTLTILTVNNNQLEKIDTELMFKVLSANHTLRTLDMVYVHSRILKDIQKIRNAFKTIEIYQ